MKQLYLVPTEAEGKSFGLIVLTINWEEKNPKYAQSLANTFPKLYEQNNFCWLQSTDSHSG